MSLLGQYSILCKLYKIVFSSKISVKLLFTSVVCSSQFIRLLQASSLLSLYGFLQIKEESIMDGSRMSLKDDLGVMTAIVGEVEVQPPPATSF